MKGGEKTTKQFVRKFEIDVARYQASRARSTKPIIQSRLKRTLTVL